MRRKLKKSQETIRDLKSKIDARTEEIKTLTIARDEANEEVVASRDKVLEREHKIQELENQKHKTEVTLKEVVSKSNTFAEQLDLTKNRLEKSTEQNTIKEERLKNYQKQIDDLEYSIKDRDSQVTRLVSDIDQAHASLIHSQEQNKFLSDEIEGLKTSLDKLQKSEKERVEKIILYKKNLIKGNDQAYRTLYTNYKNKYKECEKCIQARDELQKKAQKLNSMVTSLSDQNTNNLRNLESQRQEIQKMFDTSTKVSNQLLDYQESMDKSFMSRLGRMFNFSVDVKTGKRKKERIHYFYPSKVTDQTTLQSVREQYSEKNKKWEMVEPSKKVGYTLGIKSVLGLK